MQEPLFLLVLMIITALGVRLFLGQIHGTPIRLPRLRFRLALPSLPSLPGVRGRKRGRQRPQRERYVDDPAYADNAFDPAMSPFMAAPVPGTGHPGPARIQSLDPPEDDYDDQVDYLPANQIDFFADDDDVLSRQPALRSAPAYEQPGPYPEHDGAPGTDDVSPAAETPAVYEVPAEAEPDPNDIMSFFEKPAVLTQLPETLREDIPPVSAGQLLAEARELRALLHRDSA